MSEDWGKSRRAFIRDVGNRDVQATFVIESGADNRTLVRGLHIRMEPSENAYFRTAFWV